MENPKFVDVDGIKTRYFEAGSGEALVLIHGGHFGSYYCADAWGLNLGPLSKHFHVYALDKLGQGFTDNPKSDADYTMPATIEHTYRFLRAVGIQKATLLGHSRGALPAARIAVDHPDLVKAVIIIDTNTLAPDDPSTPKDFYLKLDANPPLVPDREFVCREPKANSFSSSHITDEFAEAMLKVALLPKVQEARKKVEGLLNPLLSSIRETKDETLDLIKAGRLKAPTLIVWGFNDPSAPIKLGWDLLHIIAPAVERTRLHVINHAGHYVFREHPDELRRQIVGFVGNMAS